MLIVPYARLRPVGEPCAVRHQIAGCIKVDRTGLPVESKAYLPAAKKRTR